ncbi:aminomethyl transferase domain containing protein, partial [Plasmodium cynomolgi strain B]
MNKYLLCRLKNRTLVQICGTDSFRFLQSLTTNDLNKIITEKDFSLYKNVPKNVLSSLDDTSAYQLCGHNVNYKKWTQGLPSLFLQNNGKILADCFLYNVKYTHEENAFSLFYMDCNVKASKMLLNILEKRKLSCDVHFSEMANIAVYQLLSDASILRGGISTGDAVGSDGDSASQMEEELSTLSNDPGIFLLSKDARNDFLGYRMYQMRGKGKKLVDEKRDKDTGIVVTTDFVNSPWSKAPNGGIDQPSNGNKKEACEMLLSFEKEEKVNLPSTFVYDYMKLNLGVVENLYSNDPLFVESTEGNASGSHGSSVYGGPSVSDAANGSRGNIDRDAFKFKDLSPFDLNYDKLNYLAKDKGCYVGQEAINRTRNEIFINKYQLTMCVNYNYLEMFLESCDSLNKTILADSFFHKYVKQINDRSLFKPTFFLLKNASKSLERAINYEQQFSVIVQKGCAKGGDSTNSSDPVNGTVVGNVFFYNHVMGLCFLIKKRIALVSGDIYSPASNVYIKNKVGAEHHRVCLFPFNYHSK